MLERLGNPRLLWYNASIDMEHSRSKKAIGADNQQERLKTGYWISGFTDGEGCFAVSIIRNTTTRFGKQIFPEFVITQGAKSLATLEKIKKFWRLAKLQTPGKFACQIEWLYF